MRRHMFPIVCVSIAVALIVVLAYGISNQGENLSIDSQIAHGHPPVAPNARERLNLLGTSSKRDLADYRGRVVVMNIFASWCDSCLGELPILEHEQLQIQNHGATLLGVTYEDDSHADMQFVAAHHLTYPVIEDAGGDLVSSFGTDQVPETFVIDRAGRVTAVMRGPVTAAWLSGAVQHAQSL